MSSFVFARGTLEHADYSQLVAQHQSGYQGLAWLIVKGNGRAIKQATAVLAVSASILEAYDEIPILDKVPEFETFTSASAAFEESKFLMLMYGNLSQFVHPSNSLINSYLPSGYDSKECPWSQ